MKNLNKILDLDLNLIEDKGIDYQLIERTDLINKLFDFHKDTSSSSDKDLIKDDIKYLFTLSDKYIFTSLSTNDYISETDDEKEFNEIYSQLENLL
jgi:hypothetical protein